MSSAEPPCSHHTMPSDHLSLGKRRRPSEKDSQGGHQAETKKLNTRDDQNSNGGHSGSGNLSAPTPLTRQALQDLHNQYKATYQHRQHFLHEIESITPASVAKAPSAQQLQRLSRHDSFDKTGLRGVGAQILYLIRTDYSFSLRGIEKDEPKYHPEPKTAS